MHLQPCLQLRNKIAERGTRFGASRFQTQLLMAKLAYDKADYASAEKALKKVENSKVDDDGLVAKL